MIYFSYRHGVETPSNDEEVDMNNAITVSINGQPVTIEINIISSDKPSQNGTGLADIDNATDDCSLALLKVASSNKWVKTDLDILSVGTYIQSKSGAAFFKVSYGISEHWIDKDGEILSSAEVALIIRKAFDHKDIYFVTFIEDARRAAQN